MLSVNNMVRLVLRTPDLNKSHASEEKTVKIMLRKQWLK